MWFVSFRQTPAGVELRRIGPLDGESSATEVARLVLDETGADGTVLWGGEPPAFSVLVEMVQSGKALMSHPGAKALYTRERR